MPCCSLVRSRAPRASSFIPNSAPALAEGHTASHVSSGAVLMQREPCPGALGSGLLTEHPEPQDRRLDGVFTPASTVTEAPRPPSCRTCFSLFAFARFFLCLAQPPHSAPILKDRVAFSLHGRGMQGGRKRGRCLMEARAGVRVGWQGC